MFDKDPHIDKDYFEQELFYLYEKMQDFSKFFPDTASKLEFNLHGSEDSQIQLMIESFAVLTSKLQKQIDQSTYSISSTILENIHPIANMPIPSQAIIKFEIDETQVGSLLKGLIIPKNTVLFRQIDDDFICKFSTETDLKLLPIEINSFLIEQEGSSIDRSKIVIGLKALKCKFSEIKMDSIRFYINAPKYICSNFFDIIFDEKTEIYLKDNKNNKIVSINKKNLKLHHFDLYKNIDYFFNKIHDSTRLIRDFFSLREKFYFFQIESEEFLNFDEDIEIVFSYNKLNHTEIKLKKSYLNINCIPIINVYRKYSEPIRLEKVKFQYKIYVNYHSKKVEELYSILDVYYIEQKNEKIYPITDYYAGYDDKQIFYEIKRDINNQNEIYLNFYDKSGSVLFPDDKLIYCNLLVTNGKMAENIKEKDKFNLDISCPVKNIEVVRFSSKFIENKNHDIHQWEILANFNYNNMPFYDSNLFIEKIRNLINISGLRYSDNSNEINKIFDSISKTTIKKKQMKKDSLSWKGYIDAYDFTFSIKNEKITRESTVVIGLFFLNLIKSYLPINNGLSITINREFDEKIIFYQEILQ